MVHQEAIEFILCPLKREAIDLLYYSTKLHLGCFIDSDLDSDDTDLDFEGSDDDTDTGGFCCNRNTNSKYIRTFYCTCSVVA